MMRMERLTQRIDGLDYTYLVQNGDDLDDIGLGVGTVFPV